MERSENLENEFYSEVNEKNVTIQNLKDIGVTDLLLKEEAIMRSKYGDKILLSEEDFGVVDVTKKAVTKIDLNEIEKMDEVKTLIEELTNNEVNSNIEFVLAKIRKEEK